MILIFVPHLFVSVMRIADKKMRDKKMELATLKSLSRLESHIQAELQSHP